MASADPTQDITISGSTTPPTDNEKSMPLDDRPVKVMNFRVILMALIVSVGGLIFGYEGGAISGYTAMSDFKNRFGDTGEPGHRSIGKTRTGCIVALLCAGCLVGALTSAPISDKFGRKYTIALWCVVYIIGNVVSITSTTKWYQVALGRLIEGLGIGALSVLTPMYQSETAPRQVRGALVCAYQLFITLGIFLAYCINYGTESRTDSSQWRITMAVGFAFPIIMGIGVLFLRESPRWDFRNGNQAEAARTLALVSGVPENHVEVQRDLREIREKLEAEESQGEASWSEVFSGPAMARRTLVGVGLQALQQLTGANFFFYYGTTIFASVGLSNSYVTSIIMGGVNFGSTFFGIYVGQRFGRRISLIIGGVWMFICFMVFASLGNFALYPDHNPNDPNARTNSGVGGAMIAFACLFIIGFAVTWGPLVWAIVGEMFPSKYRARCMALCTASNWLWNFLISFFTPFITAAINYRYGYVFAACCLLGALVVFLFCIESQQRSLEEVDTMYVLGVTPWKSSSWVAPDALDNRETLEANASSKV